MILTGVPVLSIKMTCKGGKESQSQGKHSPKQQFLRRCYSQASTAKNKCLLIQKSQRTGFLCCRCELGHQEQEILFLSWLFANVS